MLVCKRSGVAAVVDPVEPESVLAAAETAGARAVAFNLTTHGHYDHAGGNKQLSKLLPQIQVGGGALCLLSVVLEL